MRPRVSQGRLCGLFLGLLFVAGAASAQSCWQGAQVELAQVYSGQDWRELNAQGRQLVRETGTLQGQSLALQSQCADWQLRFDAQWLGGARAYDGQTQSGVPASSSAALQARNWGVELAYSLSPHWQALGRLDQHNSQRQVADTPSASGFTETFHWSQWHLGLASQWPLGPGQLQAKALWGQAWEAGMQLQLPGKAPATLRLGPVTSQQLSLRWSTPLAAGWAFAAQLAYQTTSVGQGAPAALYQNGIPVAVAQQPRTEWQQSPLQLGLVKQF